MLDVDGRELAVDIDKLLLPDLILFEDIRKGRVETDLRAIYEILDRVVVGGVARCKATDIWNITTAVIEAIGQARNPKEDAPPSASE